MFHAVDSPYLVPFDGSFRVAAAPTQPPEDRPSKKELVAALADLNDEISDLQRALYAEDRRALLLVFQALDAGGKDSTIRAVMSGIDPSGCQVHSFKQPSSEELDHDFLWRCWRRLPERGRIGIFNRSYYEEVLVVRVHPELLEVQRVPERPAPEELWRQRYESINAMEQHLARNGTTIVKFWLNVSRDEQRARFLKRIDKRSKNWKFSSADVRERGHWDAYQDAYEQALAATSRSWAPWYAIPADDKPWMRHQVATIVRDTLQAMAPAYPVLDDAERARLDEMRVLLEAQAP